MRAAGITKVHTFSFSPGPGTEADRLGDPVPPQEKKRRSRELRGLSEALGRRHRAAKLGAVEEVLVDKVADAQVVGLQPRLHALLPRRRTAGPGDTLTARAEELSRRRARPESSAPTKSERLRVATRPRPGR